MTIPEPVLERVWSRRQWALFIGGLLAVQVAFVLVLSKRTFPEVRRDGSLTMVKLAGPSSVRTAADPTLFALANESGFSGQAWLRQPRPEHSMNDWQESPHWLQIPLNRFTDEFRELARTNVVRNAAAVEQPPARIVAPEAAWPAPAAALGLQLEPVLAARGPVTTPTLPAWTSAELLAGSTVQLVVNPQGDVLSARLIASSGLKAADQKALELAAALRFKALPGESGKGSPATGLVVGNLVFRWQTLAPVGATAKPRVK